MAPPVHPDVRAPVAGLGSELHVLPEPAYKRIADLSDHLIGLRDAATLELGLKWWLHAVWDSCKRTKGQDSESTHPAVSAALVVLRDDPTRSIAEVAKATRIGPDHLNVLFRKSTDKTLVQYRTEQRINLVERLVSGRSRMGITTASGIAGFKDYSAFYRAYVRVRGTAPNTMKSEN